MRGAPETMRLYRVEGTLSDKVSYSFPIIYPFKLFNICITNTTKQEESLDTKEKMEEADFGRSFLIQI
jgi:hypothetical protein